MEGVTTGCPMPVITAADLEITDNIARALRGESYEASVVYSLEINVHNFNPSATYNFGISPG